MDFIPVQHQAYLVLGILALCFFVIYKEILKPFLAFLLTALLFMLLNIISSRDVILGLSNPSILSIVLIMIITSGLRNNYNIELIFNKVFRQAETYRFFLFKMMSRVAVLSSCVNNTPVVALLTPYVHEWGRRNNIAPSKLLIPLSFATIMGGMLTIVGTSTTLILNGFLEKYQLPPIDAVHLLLVGSAVVAAGICFLTFASNALLPNNKSPLAEFNRNQREYLMETKPSTHSKLIGKTVKHAGLRNLENMYLVEIIRRGQLISPVEPSEQIEQYDRLIFAGDTDKISDLLKSDLGLTVPTYEKHLANQNLSVIEVVIGKRSNLINKTPKGAGFRARYDAAVIAIHRQGEKLSGKIGDIKLQAGDLMLVYAGNEFKAKVDFYKDLHPISKLSEIKGTTQRQSIFFLLTSLASILCIVSGVCSLFEGLLIIFTSMLLSRMMNIEDIKNAIDLELIGTLVLSLSLGQAIVSTHAGNMIAQTFIPAFEPYGAVSMLAGLMLVTALLTSFISNVGAISIIFPITYSIAQTSGIDGTPLYLGIAFAASAAFLTPIGYQTNLIIYGPGGYTFRDFFRIGIPVSLIYLSTALFIISWICNLF
ncbi:MAG: SLC13 family permease [Cytophagales bacterium]|nr:SLC13 family permease [Cytophagales bacterium]